MKKFFKQEIHEDKTRTMGRIAIEALINGIIITGLVVYVITLFADPEMTEIIKLTKEQPITTYFIFLPAIIILIETIMIGTAVSKLPNEKSSDKKDKNKTTTKK